MNDLRAHTKSGSGGAGWRGRPGNVNSTVSLGDHEITRLTRAPSRGLPQLPGRTAGADQGAGSRPSRALSRLLAHSRADATATEERGNVELLGAGV